ncbi:MAG: Abi family protein [Balneola sp.]
MKYTEFETIMSSDRLNRYRQACGGNTRKAMTLYRRNLKLSQEFFTIISCFEVALRNAINVHYITHFGNQWLFHAAQQGGFFDTTRTRVTRNIINQTISDLAANYTHPKLVASLGFGFWRYLFATNQFRAGGQNLLRVFPNKPPSTPQVQYNANYVFSELQKINDIRNRIAHHEPICFQPGQPVIDTTYVKEHYNIIVTLFQWMDIDERDLLYGLDHIDTVIDQVDNLL